MESTRRTGSTGSTGRQEGDGKRIQRKRNTEVIRARSYRPFHIPLEPFNDLTSTYSSVFQLMLMYVSSEYQLHNDRYNLRFDRFLGRSSSSISKSTSIQSLE